MTKILKIVSDILIYNSDIQADKTGYNCHEITRNTCLEKLELNNQLYDSEDTLWKHKVDEFLKNQFGYQFIKKEYNQLKKQINFFCCHSNGDENKTNLLKISWNKWAQIIARVNLIIKTTKGTKKTLRPKIVS